MRYAPFYGKTIRPNIKNMSLKISIVTPCYNMEKYIEGTILSVISQGYDNLEYIIVDGGSTDNTIQIINKYRDKISVIISEPDNGMYDAIAKGFTLATGDICAYINADDSYFNWTFKTVNKIFLEYPNIQWIGGRPAYINEDRILTNLAASCGSKSAKDIRTGFFRADVYGYLMQESMFWRRELYSLSGGLNPQYRYAGDYDLWMKFAQYSELVSVNLPLAAFMRRSNSLSIGGADKYEHEVRNICCNSKIYPNFFWRIIHKNKMLVVFARLVTFRSTPIIYYSLRNRSFRLLQTWRCVSYHSLSTLIQFIKL